MKTLKKLLVLTLALILGAICFSTVACGKKGDTPTSVSGKTYGFYQMSITSEEETETYGCGDTYYGMTLSETFYLLTFIDGGSCSYSAMGQELSGTWTQDGKNVIVTIMNEPATFVVDGDKLTMSETEDGETHTLTLKVYVAPATSSSASSAASSSSSIQQQVNVAGNTYGFKYMKTVMSGMTMEVNVNEPFMGVTFTETYFMFYFNEDGTGIYYVEGDEYEPTTWETFTWTQEGTTVTITYVDSEPSIFEINGNEIWEEITETDPDMGEVYAIRKLVVTTTAIPQQSSSSSSSSS